MAKTATNQEQEVDDTVDTSLSDFNWDDNGDDTFFGINNDGTEASAEETKPKAKPKPETEDEEEDEESEIEDNDFTFQSSEEDEDDEEESDSDNSDKPKGKTSLTKIATMLKSNGFFSNVEIKEDEELTDERFLELQEQEHEARVDEALEEMMEGLDDDAAAFLKFKKQGGDTKKFFEIYNKTLAAPSGNIEEESYQEKVARYYYENIEDLDSEDIDDKIEWLKESGKLKKYAEKFDGKVKVLKDEQLAAEQAAIKNNTKAREDNAKAFLSTIEKTLSEVTQEGNFVFDAKIKEALKPFITKATVKTGKNTYKTGMQVKLGEALNDPKKLIIMAKLLYNDFDTTDILEMGGTKLSKSTKANVRREAPTPTNSGTGRTTKRSLADYNF